MTATDPELAHLHHAAATGAWDPAAADTLMAHLSDPSQALTREYLDLRLAAESAAIRKDLATMHAGLAGDIPRLDVRVTGQIAELDTRVTGQIAELDTRLTGQITELDTRLTGQITDLDTRLTGQITDVRTDIAHLDVSLRQALDQQTRWLIGTLLGSVLGFGSLLAASAAILA